MQLRLDVSIQLFEMLKYFLRMTSFHILLPWQRKQRPRSHRSMHHTLTHRPTVWDSAPISVRLMCLIYQSESSVVSAGGEDKTSPPPEIILLSFLVSLPLAPHRFLQQWQVSILAFVKGKNQEYRRPGGNNV